MSMKLCCGRLNVSQLTIPAVPTSELERLSHTDNTSVRENSSVSQSLNNDEEQSFMCDEDSSSLRANSDNTSSLSITSYQTEGHETVLSSPSNSMTNISEAKPVVKKKVKSSVKKKDKKDKSKDFNKKRSLSKFFKLKKHAPSSPAGHSSLKDEIKENDTGATASPEYNSNNQGRKISLHKMNNAVSDAVAIMNNSVIDSLPSSGRTSPQVNGAHRAMGASAGSSGLLSENIDLLSQVPPPNLLALNRPNRSDFEDDRARMLQRMQEMELGIEIRRGYPAYPHFQYPSERNSFSTSSSSNSDSVWSLACNFQNQCSTLPRCPQPPAPDSPPRPAAQSQTLSTFGHVKSQEGEGATQSSLFSLPPPGPCIPRTEYTQVDYIHCLVPDLSKIANCNFYWGVMDRYEAEVLLDNRPEGTFLLRDSAQDDFLFSVSFRRYGRSLHARIDQWNHKFSFDTHDPGVFAATTVTGLIEHYKDPNCCMFFEPMLTIPLGRTFPFSLQHLCRAQICETTTYDGLSYLPLPTALCQYLKYYHYKQKVRVRRMQVFK